MLTASYVANVASQYKLSQHAIALGGRVCFLAVTVAPPTYVRACEIAVISSRHASHLPFKLRLTLASPVAVPALCSYLSLDRLGAAVQLSNSCL